MTTMTMLNQQRLIDMAKKDENKLDLCVDLDHYLGTLDVESRYLQVSTIPWLIGQVKLLETHKRIDRVVLEVNVTRNSLCVYKKELASGGGGVGTKELVFQHTLSNIFKLTALSNDPQCFAYFYRKTAGSFNLYTLHAFRSARANLAQVIYDFQMQALRLHESLRYEKVFDFKLVAKLKLTQDELNIPNFIEICLEKALSSQPKQHKEQQQSQPSLSSSSKKGSFINISSTGLVLSRQNSTSSTSSTKTTNSTANANNSMSKTDLYLTLLSDKRVLLKFGLNRLYLQETDARPCEHEYKHVVYLNNSITNENFFCLAYTEPSPPTTTTTSSRQHVNGLILYSDNVELIDDVIREYAVNVSSELNVIEQASSNHNHHNHHHQQQQSPVKFDIHSNTISDELMSPRFEQHTCMMCPMQQFVELCDYLKEYDSHPHLIYDILTDKLNYNLDSTDQAYLYECMNSNKELSKLLQRHPDEDESINTLDYLIDLNQVIMGLIHKLCERKQRQHLVEYFIDTRNHHNPKSTTNIDLFKFLMPATSSEKISRFSKTSKSVYQNLSNFAKPSRKSKKRSSSLGSSSSLESLIDSAGSRQQRQKDRLRRPHNKLTSLLFANNSLIKKSQSSLCSSQSQSRKPSQLLSFLSSGGGADLMSNKSIRKYIFNKIVGGAPNSNTTASEQSNTSNGGFKFKRFKNPNDVRQFWKKVISEQIILSKMEKEHRKMNVRANYLRERHRQEKEEQNSENNNGDANKLSFSASLSSSALNYVEITPCLKEVDKIWTQWLSQTSDSQFQIDLEEIRKTVFRGVPQNRRETIWFWLIEQFKKREGIKKSSRFTNTNDETMVTKNSSETSASYSDLVKHTTIHQHAILLDLGRTFPSHTNFAKKFGCGQLALFNVLKAYSVLDSEVGYCQGLSFIVGILLIHVNNDEEKAFQLLRFLLVDLNFREQYKPDMMQLQKHMYQLTRLLYKHLPDVYLHFDANDISPSLYAAPWFLTLFSSQFQIGFVARVFDFLFAEGSIILFNLSVAILSIHKPLLLSCDSFETIVNHIKTTIPEMSLIESELIINKAFTYDFAHDLETYAIEFGILHDEYELAHLLISSSSSLALKSEESSSSSGIGVENTNSDVVNNDHLENERLRKEVKDLNEMIQLLKLQIHNQDDQFYKMYHENKQLKCKVDALEIERNGLLKKIKEQSNKLLSK